MKRDVCIMAGLICGAAVAAGLVLLFAPQSGAETQRLIRERIDAVLVEGRQAAEMRRLELTAEFDALKQPQPKG